MLTQIQKVINFRKCHFVKTSLVLFILVIILRTYQRKNDVCLSTVNDHLYSKLWRRIHHNITVVTAYFDLGNIPKGSFWKIRYADSYNNWTEVYRYLHNPLIVYTDSYQFAKYIKTIRISSTFFTKIVVISRRELWSFQILPNISELYSKPGYPKHFPNTYIPEYTSMTHSKLTLLVKAIESNYINSEFYSWVDLGYFREIAECKHMFYLDVPSDFDDSKVGVTRVHNSDMTHISAKDIILKNKNWIGGGLFLGKSETLKKFETQYKRMVNYYLTKGLMNTEQQILYSMYTAQERRKHPISVEVQLYIPGDTQVISKDPWFYLGYLMYHEILRNTTKYTH